ncbi:MAG: cell division protein FtsW [Ignavibacteriales bacterium]|nr:cell division protein FtsW [Ignavibacteriales bacterium]
MKSLVKILSILTIGLMLLGALFVFTASEAYSVSKFPNEYYLFNSHIFKMVLAFVLLIVFAIIPYKYYQEYSKVAIIGIILILIITILFAPKVKGAARWIDLGFIKFQPSEAAKLILIIHLANLISKKDELIKNFKQGFIYPLIWIVLVSSLIIFQPNLSTAIIVILVSYILLFVGGARLKHIITTLGSVTAVSILSIFLFPHSRERLLNFINGVETGHEINLQVMNAKIALGSGGLFGVGLGHSRQSDLFLPEAYGDFIFSIVGEETGFFGAIIALSIYLTIFIVGLLIAKKTEDKFAQLLVFGLSLYIALTVIINVAVVTGMLPTTGITLPFISFGGTSIMFFAITIGIIINVALQTQKTRDIRVLES